MTTPANVNPEIGVLSVTPGYFQAIGASLLREGTHDADGAELAAAADGMVWESAQDEPTALRSWVTGPGTRRHLGTPPPGATVLQPTLDTGTETIVVAALAWLTR